MRFRRLELMVCLFLIVATISAFGQLRNHNFVNYDDSKYVTQNPHVQAGLTREGIIWAFTTSHAGNWHPLTWLSHMLDCQMYGLNAGGHHLTSLLFHIVNALLVFAVFNRMTKGALWQSAFVAVLFALHPLHVESVAWAAERKDVLSTFFWMMTMWAYVLYVELPRLSRYLLVLLFFALGLMAKPMLVTLPFVLLLMDYWPLERSKSFQSDHVESSQSNRHLNPVYHRSLGLLVLEKAPFFVLVAVSSAVTFLVQRAGGAVKSLDVFPLHGRLANAIVSYVIYVWKFIWPSNLAVFYPHPGMRPIWLVVVCVVLLLTVSVLVIRQRYRRPYLATGWLWYLGTLVPVIGVVQVGTQSMADRYTYVPLIGLLIIIAWGGADLTLRWTYRRFVLATSAGVILVALMMCTYLQLRHWRNSMTVLEHALDVTVDNNLAHYNLGQAFAEQGKFDEAIAHYSEAIRIKPHHPDAFNAYNNIGIALFCKGKLDEAIANYSKALRLKPDSANIYDNLGNALAKQGRLDEAIAHYSEALRIQPDSFRARNDMGVALVRKGRLDEAIACFSRALKIKPDCAEASHNLRLALGIADKPGNKRSN